MTTTPTITSSSRSGGSPRSRRTNPRYAACGTRSRREQGKPPPHCLSKVLRVFTPRQGDYHGGVSSRRRWPNRAIEAPRGERGYPLRDSQRRREIELGMDLAVKRAGGMRVWRGGMSRELDDKPLDELEVIIPNLNWRYSGGTAANRTIALGSRSAGGPPGLVRTGRTGSRAWA